MKIGLLFGSFNPIHIGHLIVANSMLEMAKLDQVWLVITPQNPFKINKIIVDKNIRLKMAKLAIKDNPNLKTCTIEFDMPQPNYTINTLNKLKEKYNKHTFSIIMGEDNLLHFETWKEYEKIVENYEILVYPRSNLVLSQKINHPHIHIYMCPQIEISATMIRNNLKTQKSIQYLVHHKVEKYLQANIIY